MHWQLVSFPNTSFLEAVASWRLDRLYPQTLGQGLWWTGHWGPASGLAWLCPETLKPQWNDNQKNYGDGNDADNDDDHGGNDDDGDDSDDDGDGDDDDDGDDTDDDDGDGDHEYDGDDGHDNDDGDDDDDDNDDDGDNDGYGDKDGDSDPDGGESVHSCRSERLNPFTPKFKKYGV